MLASILHHNNIPCGVYERDSSAVARAQGGTLDIHEYSGQQALHAAGLLGQFRAVMRLGGDALRRKSLDASPSPPRLPLHIPGPQIHLLTAFP